MGNDCVKFNELIEFVLRIRGMSMLLFRLSGDIGFVWKLSG